MSKGSFKISTQGFKSLEKRLEGMSKEVVQQVSDVIDDHIFEINKEQIANVTRQNAVKTGFLRGSNKFEVSQPTYKEVFNNANYAAFVEFGTGGMAKVPAELTEYANQFEGTKGRKVNLPARPFFFAPFFKRRTAMLRDIVKVLQKFGN